MAELRLSVLDQSPVPSGSTPGDALQNSVSLARHVDALGYHRLWYSEHHAMDLLAGSAPEIILARIGAETSRIRIGSGGIMLPHYSSFKVAEVFNTLATFYPGRIDLGIGRAPGGGQLEMHALRRSRTGPIPDDFPQQLAELLAFLHPEEFPHNHPFARMIASPVPSISPDVWLLGSSMWSSMTAANEGLPYAFAHFFSPVETRHAIETLPRKLPAQRLPRAATVPPSPSASICAETAEEAERLHLSVKLSSSAAFVSTIAAPSPRRRKLRSKLAELPTPPNPLLPFSLGALDAPESEFPRYIVGTPRPSPPSARTHRRRDSISTNSSSTPSPTPTRRGLKATVCSRKR